MASPSGRGSPSVSLHATDATRPVEAGRWAAIVAIAGTVAIAAGAFYLSFASLTHLAELAGLTAERAWVWPLLVDGMIVVATVAVTTLRGRRSAYAWVLLAGGAAVSILANAVHAALIAPADVPVAIAVLVAATPPLVLVASTHLTVQLRRAAAPRTPAEPAAAPKAAPSLGTALVRRAAPAPPRAARADARQRAIALREESGLSNRAIARELSIHPSTVGRWLGPPDPEPPAPPAGPEGDPDE
ncbi:MAG: DUF2637 domain-containing protein [Actinomycetales bacterium]|nr:DUF2637 domain-containing protein [Actinomycetales bacterium]